jgi:hypothetical protein
MGKVVRLKPHIRTEGYLQEKYPLTMGTDNLMVNAAFCPDTKLVDTVKTLPSGYFLVKGTMLIATRNPAPSMTTQKHLSTAMTLLSMIVHGRFSERTELNCGSTLR